MIADGLWRRELRRWLPPLLFCLVNGAALAGYKLALAGEGESAERGLAARRAALAELQAERQRVAELEELARQNNDRLVQFYSERLGTEGERLTKVLTEVQELAQRAGLAPSSFTYPDQPIQEFGLVQRAIVFGVRGTYEQLRRFVNFLELSESFLTLQAVSLSDRGRGQTDLSISLRLSTLFVLDGVDPQRLAVTREAVPGEVR